MDQNFYGYSEEQWNEGLSIYNQLGAKTVNPGSRILIRPWYGRKGVEQTRAIYGVYTLRVHDMKYHLGNPYSSVKRLVDKDGLIQVDSTKDAVVAFICWVLYSTEDRAIIIREWLALGILKNKPIVYYKELNEPSHATALEWLIDNFKVKGK